jgi:hypothetical protein
MHTMAFVDALVSEKPARVLLRLMAQHPGVVPIRQVGRWLRTIGWRRRWDLGPALISERFGGCRRIYVGGGGWLRH